MALPCAADSLPRPRETLLSRCARPETGTDYWIFIYSDSERDAHRALPAVAFLDGDDQFAPAVVAYQELRDSKQIAPLLLVDVGYRASYAKPANKRGRNYTPFARQ